MGNSQSTQVMEPLTDLDKHLQFTKTKMKLELATTIIGLSAGLFFSWYAIRMLLQKMDSVGSDKQQFEERAKKIMTKLNIKSDELLSEHELCIACNLVDTDSLEINWKDIGGLQPIIEEIKEVIILPFTRPDLFSSALLQPPKGVLLYGPPGCGKTMIAKATAKASGARFINLQASALYDKWYGESQKRAEAIFSLAHKLQPTIIFIDEIDAFLRERGSNDHEATALIKAQFMSLWDGLATDRHSKVLIMGATNRPMDVDPAFRRRMPCMLQILQPGEQERGQILRVILREEDIVDKERVIKEVANKTEGLTGSDLKELCRHAAIYRVRDYLSNEPSGASGERPSPSGRLRNMRIDDFNKALEKFRSMSIQLSGMGMVHDAIDG